jgi:hypothetical protein
MMLLARTLGPGARLLPVQLTEPATQHVKAWAVSLNTGTLHVLLINKGPHPARIRLALQAAGSAQVQRLLAPAPSSRFGVTLGGQWLDHNGRWRGSHVLETVTPADGSYTVTLRGYSAALLSVRSVAA